MIGEEVKTLIETQITEHSQGVVTVLAKYRLKEAVASLHATIRAVEEFINIPRFSVTDDDDRKRLLSISLADDFLADPERGFRKAGEMLRCYVKPGVVERYCETMLASAAIGAHFRRTSDQTPEAGVLLTSIGSAADYYQSRRRHLVSLLYTMPAVCRGAKALVPADTLGAMLPLIEYSCATITGLYQKLVMMDVLDGFELKLDKKGFSASHNYDPLETDFLEPERASIQVMYDLREDQIDAPELEPATPDLVFSAAELRNSPKFLSACYAAYGLDDVPFLTLKQLITLFARYCRDNYFIEIPLAKFQSMLRSQTAFDCAEIEDLLVNSPADYSTNSNAYEPFIRVGDVMVSNVNLLSRFLYAFKNLHLASRKRFQIHAGFIFEDLVTRDLNALGFSVTDIKRINRKEFDVVTTLGDVIYNFQCKNNALDLTLIESNRKLFVRYNRSMVNYYKKALDKEHAREVLLKSELGLNEVEHYVISRFPVITDHPRILNYNQLATRLSSVLEAK